MKNLYFKEYWVKDDLFCNQPEVYCILYCKTHRWSPFWKRVGRFTDDVAIIRCLLEYDKDFTVHLKHPVYGYLRIREYLTKVLGDKLASKWDEMEKLREEVVDLKLRRWYERSGS